MAPGKSADGLDQALRLCFVDRPWAWFTTNDLEEQWGDDWDDAPWQHNAGRPYMDKGTFVKVAFTGNLYAPGEKPRDEYDGIGERFKDGVSVKTINRDFYHPWLVETDYGQMYGKAGVKIWAGTSLEEFVAQVEGVGGRVYRAV